MLKTNHDQSRRAGLHRGRLSRGVLWGLCAWGLTSCQTNQQRISLGDLASSYNREVMNMGLWAIALSIIIFVGVSGLLFYTVQRFREDRHDGAPAQFHGNDKLEVWLVAVPMLIVIGLSVLSVRSMARLNPVSKQSVGVEAVGAQFWWNFSYPTYKAAAGGVVSNGNEMLMPTQQKVAVTLTSKDVIHGFWAPNIGGQRAAIPTVKKVWEVDTDRAGVYQGNCSQLCGGSHANMRYKVVALDQARFEAIMKAAQEYKAPIPAAGSPEERGYNLFVKGNSATGAVPCAACHRVQGTPAAGAAGPDLSFFGTRRTLAAGMWEAMTTQQWQEPSAAAHLHAWIKNSTKVKPGSLMPPYDGSTYRDKGVSKKAGTLTDAEIDDLAAYLRSLKLPDGADYWKDTPVYGVENTPGGRP